MFAEKRFQSRPRQVDGGFVERLKPTPEVRQLTLTLTQTQTLTLTVTPTLTPTPTLK